MFKTTSHSAGGIIFNKGMVCLVRDKRLDLDNWFIPKGRIEEGEKPLEAAKREIKEETGIKNLKLIKKLGIIKRPTVTKKNELKIIDVYLFETIQEKLKPEEDYTEARWFSIEDAVEKLYTKQEKNFFKNNIRYFSQIKYVIFDFGGVFTIKGNFEPFIEKNYRKFKVRKDDFIKVVKESWEPAKLGLTDSREFWIKISNYLNCDVEDLRRDIIDSFGFRPEILKLAKSLKKRYKLGLITNHIQDWLEEEIKNRKLDEVFDVIVPSYKFKVSKPEKKIYTIALKKLKARAWECVFIDDMERNIDSARKMGLKTILFKNPKNLRVELKKLGVEA